MTVGPATPHIIKFAVPLILGSLFQLTYNSGCIHVGTDFQTERCGNSVPHRLDNNACILSTSVFKNMEKALRIGLVMQINHKNANYSQNNLYICIK